MKFYLYYLGLEDGSDEARELVAVEDAADESEMEDVLMEAVRMDILGRQEYAGHKAYAFAPEQEPNGIYSIMGAAAPNAGGANTILYYEAEKEKTDL